jgi:hypothetical protein
LALAGQGYAGLDEIYEIIETDVWVDFTRLVVAA